MTKPSEENNTADGAFLRCPICDFSFFKPAEAESMLQSTEDLCHICEERVVDALEEMEEEDKEKDELDKKVLDKYEHPWYNITIGKKGREIR